MEENEALIVPVELRESEADDDSPGSIHGLILPVGRIAADRKEVFTPGSATFPEWRCEVACSNTRAATVMTFAPVVVEDGYRIEAALPNSRLEGSKPPST